MTLPYARPVERPTMTNAVAYALFHAKGGWKVNGIIAGVVTLIVTLAVVLTTQLAEDRWQRALESWTYALFALQNLVLALGGVVGVSAAVRADVISGMHDSLRLSRVSPWSVVLGYVMGGALQPACVFLPVLAAGLVAAELGSRTGALYAFSSMLMAALALLLMVFAALASMVIRQQGIPLLACMVGVPACVGLSYVCPPLAVFMGPLAKGVTFGTRSSDIEPAMVLCMVFQVALGFILFRAAARKFLYPHRPAFRADLGLAVLGLWAAAGLLAMLVPGVFNLNLRPFRGGTEGAAVEPWMIAGTLVPGFVLMLVPLLAAASASADAWNSLRHGADAPGSPRSWLPVAAAATVLVLLPMAMAWRLPVAPRPSILLITVVAVGGYGLLLGAFARRVTVKWKLGIALAALLAVVVLLVPLLCEWLLMLAEGFTRNYDLEGPRLAQFSPAFLVGAVWQPHVLLLPTHFVAAGAIAALGVVSLFVFRLPTPSPVKPESSAAPASKAAPAPPPVGAAAGDERAT